MHLTVPFRKKFSILLKLFSKLCLPVTRGIYEESCDSRKRKETLIKRIAPEVESVGSLGASTRYYGSEYGRTCIIILTLNGYVYTVYICIA